MTGIRIFLATHSETAAAIFGVISPQSAFAKMMPMGPTMTSAHVQFTTTGFSPVAAASAPARSMALVARLFVPTATTSASGMFFLIWSVSAAPILPPWPSITSIFMCYPSVGSFVSPSRTAETGSSPYISDVQLICMSPTVTGLPSEYTSSLESVMPAAS